MKKTFPLSTALLLSLFILTGCSCKHEKWDDATCSAPKTCVKCGITEGETLEHDWIDANCETPVTCSLCGETAGSALGHSWTEADCTTAKTCATCGKTEGNPEEHVWETSSCDQPQHCVKCGTANGTASGHKWLEATLTESQKCSVCGETKGSALGKSSLGTGYINTLEDGLNLRKYPNTSSEILASIPKGTAVSLYSCDSADWYIIEYSGKTGYISADYVSFEKTSESSSGRYLGIGTVKTQGSPLYIRNTKEYTEASKIGQIPNGQTVSVYDCGDSKWYRVSYNGITGYASAEFIVLGSSSSGSSSGSSSVTLQDICDLLAENDKKEGHNTSYTVSRNSNGKEYIVAKSYTDGVYDALTTELQIMQSYTAVYDAVGYDNDIRDLAEETYDLHLERQEIWNSLCETVVEMCEYVGIDCSVEYSFYDSNSSYSTPVYISYNGYESWDAFDELMSSYGYYYP